MSETMQELLNDSVFYNFSRLCEIPHGSYNERQLSNFLLKWAKERGFKAVQDDHMNVAVYKPASKGCESAPSVILQAHIDMVCEKAPFAQHDFKKDPIHLQLDGDILSTGGRTTLGADDGIGAALAMEVLESESLRHPALEVVFTTAEEEDLSGALAFDGSLLQSHLLINLDHGVDNQIILGSAGGIGAEIEMGIERMRLPSGCDTYEVRISGLPGGHSGENINCGNGNAIVLLGRLLHEYQRIGALITEAGGGNFRTALPREAFCKIAIKPSDMQKISDVTAEMRGAFIDEYGAVAPNFSINVVKSAPASSVLAPASTAKLLYVLYLSPNGIAEMNNKIAGVVASSDNLGEFYMDGKKCRFVYEIRSIYGSMVNFMRDKLEILCSITGASMKTFSPYPGWDFNADSELRRLANDVYKKEFGAEPQNIVLHAGLEVGCFYAKIPGLEAISIGPNAWNLHSPDEKLSVSSTRKMERFLDKLLETLADRR